MALLEDKVAIVTGGGFGIGRAHALLLAEHGARVLVNDTGGALNGTGSSNAAQVVADEIRKAGGEAVADTHSVASFEGADAIVKAAVEQFGGVDILVNNAGILRDRTLLKMAPEEWQAVIDVHLTGTFACLQAGARQMVAQGRGGRIINTSSSSGLLGNFGQANYGAAKAGIHMLTRIASMELASKGITVNAIAPNAYTRMTKDLPGMASYTEEEMGPQFMAPIVVYLASDQAANVTGQTFGVNQNQLFVYKMLVSEGVNKRGLDPWEPEQIGAVIQRAITW
jgi:NAD(P)-dependent dehydrogenase (short-subunit alcohol dehydrogenase family)